MRDTVTPPQALAVIPENIPAELRTLDQWVCWKFFWRGGKYTKVPIDPATGGHADATRRATWGTFEAALARYERDDLAGIGFVFAEDDPYCGIDLDDCLDGGRASREALLIHEELASYAETTPSGRGVHIIVRAVVPGGKGRKNTRAGVEIYDRGRFFTVTGHRRGVFAAIAHRQDQLDALHARLFPVQPVEDAAPPPAPAAAPDDDRALLDRAVRAKNGDKFDRLWRGDRTDYGSESEADLALCSLLAFWCGPDRARVDGLFRRSGLYRTKWERATYREPTLDKAFERTEYFDWHAAGRIARLMGGDMPDDEEAGGEEGGAEHAPREPSTEAIDYEPTDTGNGRLFAARFRGELRFDHRRGVWLRWMGHWWQDDADGHAFRLTEHIPRAWAVAIAQESDEKRQRALRKWSLICQSLGRREAMLTVASKTKPLTTDGLQWDGDPYLLGVLNGVVDLRTGALHDGHPNDRITMHAPVPYDPDAVAPRWEQFLAEVFREDEGLIGYLQRFAGYSLTGDTREHKLLICYGKGSNGKSTLLNVLAQVAGSYGYAMPFATLEAQRYSGGPTNDLAALVGRRLVTASEVAEGQQLNEARVKSLSGGDPITARFLNKEFFTFRPVAKFWLAVNHKPTIKDDSKGFWRRIDTLPFLASFEGSRVNKDLEAELLAEGAGILAWMVRGCLDWQRGGLRQPETILAATKEYERESDPVGPFLDAACVTGEHQIVRANALYLAYLDWANDEGLRDKELLTSQRFGRLLGDRYEKTHDRQGTLYRGLGLSLEWQERKMKGGSRAAS